MTAPTPTTWRLQASARKQGTYYQAIFGKGEARVAVTIGYQTPEVAETAIANLSAWGHKLFATDAHGKRLLSAAELRMIALDEGDQSLKGLTLYMEEQETRALMEADDLGTLTLQVYYDRVWKKVRPDMVRANTWEGEQTYWPTILSVLGGVKLRNLNMARWSTFLAGRETWSGRTRLLAQNAYRQLLKFAFESGDIESVHPFRQVRGSTKRTRPEAIPLTLAEVPRVLAAADTPMHRALYGVAIGQGLRPSEAARVCWEDLDWEAATLHVRGTKTDLSKSTVPLTDLAYQEMRRFWFSLGAPSKGACFTYSGKQITQWKVGFRNACKRAKIGHPCYPYLCRHSFATLAVAAGCQREAIRKMMRHSSRSQVLEQAYVRLSSAQVAEGMAAFPTLGTGTEG